MSDRTAISVPHFNDIISRIAKFETFQVADRLYSADYLIPQLTINAKDLIVESATCGALTLYWGIEAARARRHLATVEAAYRSWRDRKWMDLKNTPMAQGTGDDTKYKYPSDAVAEKQYRTHPEYGTWQQRQISARESAECAEAVYEAFKVKRDLIRSMERIMNDEAGGAYFVTEEPPQMVARQPQLGDPNE